MPTEILFATLVGSAAGWLIPHFFRKSTIGTRYRSERDCKNCETRTAVQEIRVLVVELAIKAGVPPQEVSKFAGNTGRRYSDGV